MQGCCGVFHFACSLGFEARRSITAKMFSARGCIDELKLALVYCLLSLVVSEESTEAGKCAFPNLPAGVGSYWDPNCKMGDIGCNADGENLQCRLCGAGDFLEVPCPPSACKFAQAPYVPYYWDPDCHVGKLGCWADGVHEQCRFCGDFPYTGVSCPEGAAAPQGVTCAFANEPETKYFWDPSCAMGRHGCNADGEHVHCRFCGWRL